MTTATAKRRTNPIEALFTPSESATTEYGLTRLRARVTLDNPASRKVLEHDGFVAGGSLTLNGKPAGSTSASFGDAMHSSHDQPSDHELLFLPNLQNLSERNQMGSGFSRNFCPSVQDQGQCSMFGTRTQGLAFAPKVEQYNH